MSVQSEFNARLSKLAEAESNGLVSTDDGDAIRELCFAFNEQRPEQQRPHWPDVPSHLTSYRELNTLANWCYHLTRIAQEVQLTDTTPDELNQLWGDMLRGDTSITKNGGLAKSSIRSYQNTTRMFYRYHSEYGIEYDDISVFQQDDTSISPSDMLTPEEIEQVRQAPDNPRDKAIVYLLLYTGMRKTALRTLRVKDIDMDNSRYYFNTDADGLKGISRPEEPRPLLGAEAAVRDWLRYHPTNDPEHYLLTTRPSHGRTEPSKMLAASTVYRTMKNVKQQTGIEKPLHPHAARHNFVSVCKREYGMDDDAVKFLIGHSPDSTVMSTTYAHLSGEDYAQKAEVAAGIRDETESSLSPEEYCDNCGEPLPSDARACPSCGVSYTPDAKAVEDEIKQSIRAALVESDDAKIREILGDIDVDIEDNPELLKELIDWKQGD